MPSILNRDKFDTFTLGITMLIAGYVLSAVLLVEQYVRHLPR